MLPSYGEIEHSLGKTVSNAFLKPPAQLFL